MADLLPGHDAFHRLGNVLDALPTRLDDGRPLRDVMPGAWPTVGDLRKLCAEFETVAATLAAKR
jgi:hypothetical protein